MAKDQITLTQRRIKNVKLFIYVCLIIAVVADAAVFIALAACQVPAKYWVVPLILAAVDVLFLAVSFAVNYRFSYSLPYLILYAIAVLGLSVASALIGNDYGAGTPYTFIAHLLFPMLHLIIAIAVVAVVLFSAKTTRTAQTASAIVCLVLLGCAVGYGAFGLSSGYFGQGAIDEKRVLLYSLDEGGRSYSVVGVESGRGKKIIIPDTFDGKPISSVDCAVFNADGVNSVRLDCGKDIELKNTAELSKFDGARKISVAKADIDYFRAMLFDGGYTAAARSFEPTDVEDGGVYVTFDYDPDAAVITGGYLPTWYGKAGDTFTLGGDAPEWYVHSDATSADDLHLGYTSRNRKIFDGFMSGAENINNAKLTESKKNVGVRFADIYRIKIAEDNDGVYESPDSYKYATVDGKTLDCRYTVKKYADSVLTQIPARTGFSVAFKYEANKVTGECSSLSQVLDGISSEYDVTLTPEWTLSSPLVGNLSTPEGQTYGNKVVFGTAEDAVSPAANIDLKYEWTRDGVSLGITEPSFTNDCIGIDEGGEYKLTVTAYSKDNTVTTLTSTVERSVNITVAKRKLHFDWKLTEHGKDTVDLPASAVYDGYSKDLSVVLNAEDVVAGDAVEGHYSRSTSGVTNVGTYPLSVTLDSADLNAKYDCSGVVSFAVTRAPLTIAVDSKTKSYDGKPFNDGEFTYTAEGLLGSDSLGTPKYISDALSKKDCATYNISVMFPDAETSGVLYNYSTQYNPGKATINKKKITLTWSNPTVYTYNGKLQGPTVVLGSDVIDADKQNLIDYDIKYNAAQVNAGDHTRTATLNSKNYTLGESETISQSYTIDPKPVEFIWTPIDTVVGGDLVYTYTYNGENQHPEVEEIDGLADGETYYIPTWIIYDGSHSDASDETYTVTARLNGDVVKNYKLANEESQKYRINKKAITLAWIAETDYTYNGRVQSPTVNAINDVVGAYDINTWIVYGGQGTNASDTAYTVAVSLNGSIAATNNYELTGETSKQYKINKAPLTVTAASAYKIYDTEPFTVGRDITHTAVGLVNGEELTAPVYTCDMLTDANVGMTTVSVAFGPMDSDTLKNYEVSYVDGTAEIAKRVLTPTWNTASSVVYDGSAHELKIASLGNLPTRVTADSVLSTIVYENNTLTDVGSVTATAKMPDGSNYQLGEDNTSSATLTVTQKPITLTWNAESEYVYNGSAQSPTVSAISGVVGDAYDISTWITYSGIGTDASDTAYTVTASLNGATAATKNYVLSGDVSKSYKITKKPITLTWNAESEYVYNGSAQSPTVSAIDGVVGDAYDISKWITYSGIGTDASDTAYTVTVSLNGATAATKNYVLSGDVSKSYKITKKPITLTWNAESEYVYNGEAQSPTVSAISGVVGDAYDISTWITYSGIGTDASDTPYTVTVSLNGATAATKNYVLSGDVSKSYKITKKTLIPTWQSGKTFVYNGESHSLKIVGINGFADLDVSGVLAAISYSGSCTDVGSAFVTATLDHKNYKFDGEIKETVTVTAKPLTVTAVGKTKPYDGNPFTASDFKFTADGLVTGESLTAPNYACDKLTDANVGSADVTVSFGAADSATIKNYSVTYNKGSAQITPATVTLTWKIENGEEFTTDNAPVDFVTASIADAITVAFTGTGIDGTATETPTGAGSYTVTVTVGDNYVLGGGGKTESRSYTITEATPAPAPTPETPDPAPEA